MTVGLITDIGVPLYLANSLDNIVDSNETMLILSVKDGIGASQQPVEITAVSKLQIYEQLGTPTLAQQWILVPTEAFGSGHGPYYFIKSALLPPKGRPPFVLDVRGGVGKPGAILQLYEQKQTAYENQLWSFSLTNDAMAAAQGVYLLSALIDSDGYQLVADVPDPHQKKTAPSGSSVQVYPMNTEPTLNQSWFPAFVTPEGL